MKRMLAAVGVVCAMVCGAVPARAQAVKHHVLFALTSGDQEDWRTTVGNIKNLLAGEPEGSTEVEVVAYAQGLSFEKKGSPYEAAILELEKQGVRFTACENSMRMQKVTKEDLVQGVEPVPSGIVEVVTKQEQGWTYVKAGR